MLKITLLKVANSIVWRHITKLTLFFAKHGKKKDWFFK